MKLLITGAQGMLARAVQRVAAEQGHAVTGFAHDTLDVTDENAVRTQLGRRRPDAVIQCAAFTRVDDAESQRAAAFAVNALGARAVARACADLDAALVYPSTDYVFSGRTTRPYRPTDPTDPLNVYGESKAAGEEYTRTAGRHYVVRTSWLYGAGGRNFVATVLQQARSGAALRVVNDQRGCPTWTHDLARSILLLLEQAAPTGTYHACNRGEASWYDLACATLQLSGISARVTPIASHEFECRAQRPAFSVLDCGATEQIVGPLRPWRVALSDALVAGV
jgi:dTDP-4-dehydrorhamnose reductase